MRSLRPALATAVVTLAACDIPSEPPIFESRWVVPAEETTIAVAELLPDDVRVSPDGSSFEVTVASVAFFETLGGLCPACALADGLVVPKPAFDDGFETGSDLPAEVTAVTLTSGAVDLELVNGFNFDPLRPAAGVTGVLTLELRDSADGDLLGVATLDGVSTSFPAGSTTQLSVPLSAGTLDGQLLASVAVTSPEGDPILMDADLFLDVSATPRDLRVSSAVVDVSGRSLDLDPVDLDVEDIDQSILDRIEEGGFILDIANPFGVGAQATLTVQAPGLVPIQKAVAIGPDPVSEVRVAFTGEELRSFLGRPAVVLTGTASVDGAAGSILVSPGQELVLTAELDLTLRIGG